MLIKHEGVRLFVYNDTQNIPTIGCGRNLRDRGLTMDEAMYLLNNDIADFQHQLFCKLSWFYKAPVDVQNVLTDMAFEMGITGLMAFQKTLNLISLGQYAAAAEEMLNSTWAKQVPARANDLANILKAVI